MNPAGYPGEAPVVVKNEGNPGQPGVVPYTVISEPPKDHIIWSLCCFVYSNPCCLGLAALIFSIRARDRKMVGDVEGARHYASTARCLNIWATVLGSIIILICMIVIIATPIVTAALSRARFG